MPTSLVHFFTFFFLSTSKKIRMVLALMSVSNETIDEPYRIVKREKRIYNQICNLFFCVGFICVSPSLSTIAATAALAATILV